MSAALRFALLIVLGCACLTGAAAAQAPEGTDAAYSLSWWTVDGGGVSYGAGSVYTLGGTAGQPDAAPQRNSGDGVYTLRAGFWLPSCVVATVNVTAAVSGETVSLSWTPNPAGQAYQIHRGTTPYFTPTDATRHDWVTAGPWPDPTSPVGVGDPLVNYYYLVRPTCGAAYVDAVRAGEFDFALTPGGS